MATKNAPLKLIKLGKKKPVRKDTSPTVVTQQKVITPVSALSRAASAVFARDAVSNAKEIEYRTKVSYRKSGTNLIEEQVFTGALHSKEAHDFCIKHVGGLSVDEYKRASHSIQKLYALQTLKMGDEVRELYIRSPAVWNWHCLAPEIVADGVVLTALG